MEIRRLGDICNFISGVDKTDKNSIYFNNEYIYWIKLGNIKDNNIYYFNSEKLSNKEVKGRAKNGDLLVCWSTNAGLPIIVDRDILFSTAFYKIEIKTNLVLKKYLYFWFIKNKTNIESNAVGSVLKKINKKLFSNIPIKIKLSTKEQQQIINIIEPFEKKYTYLINKINIYQSIIKLSSNIFDDNLNSNIKLSDLVFTSKTKRKKSNYVLDLSKISSDSFINNEYSNVNDFKTNIFGIDKGDFFISSIRPKLKKYGIAIFNTNVLGTLHILKPIDKNNIGYISSIISSNNFLKYQIKNSYGTKMPIINIDKIMDYKINFDLTKKWKELFNFFIKKIITYNSMIFYLRKIINNLIDLYIN